LQKSSSAVPPSTIAAPSKSIGRFSEPLSAGLGDAPSQKLSLPSLMSAMTRILTLGVERTRYGGDEPHAELLERWLPRVIANYADAILPFDDEVADIVGRLRVRV
jgi:hypothetical protein